MIKITIVEDNLEWAEQLRGYIYRFAEGRNYEFKVEHFKNGLDFISDYDFNSDIIFMDIEMEYLNGLDAARKLRKMDCRAAIVFVTNMAQYALYGYEVDAVDFIVKPVKYQNFVTKFEKALRCCTLNRDATVRLRTDNGIRFLPYSSIYYMESQKHYILMHTKEGEIRMRASMEETEKMFSAQNFARCSKFYLVNLAYVKSVTANSVYVNDVELVVGRTKKDEFMDKLAQYFGAGGQ